MKDQAVLVFGGNRGIGAAIVDGFVHDGARVMYASRSPRASTVPFIEADLTDPAVGAQVVDQAASAMGALDTVVFGSATFDPRGGLGAVSLEQVTESLTVNLLSAYSALTAAINHLTDSDRGGRFIVISSITGPRTGLSGMAPYAMAKAGLEGLVRTAAIELASVGITVNAVEPGLIRTESLEANYGPERLALMDAMIPGGAMGTPQDIAAAVQFLASSGARHINGAVLVVDGALTLTENPYAP